jgi:hypothetical protein
MNVTYSDTYFTFSVYSFLMEWKYDYGIIMFVCVESIDCFSQNWMHIMVLEVNQTYTSNFQQLGIAIRCMYQTVKRKFG